MTDILHDILSVASTVFVRIYEILIGDHKASFGDRIVALNCFFQVMISRSENGRPTHLTVAMFVPTGLYKWGLIYKSLFRQTKSADNQKLQTDSEKKY